MKTERFSTRFIMCLIVPALLFACSSEKPKIQKQEKETQKYDNVIKASLNKIPRFYEAVGTIRPATEVSIESQTNGQIKKVLVVPGVSVLKEQPLVVLDDREHTSRLYRAKEGLRSARAVREQAIQNVEAAKAALVHAEADYTRTKKLLASEAATARQFEKAEAVWKQAIAGKKNSLGALSASESGIKQAEELVTQAEISLGYTIMKAPSNGVVLKKTAEVGDIAVPGRQLLLLRTNSLLRIEANVREGLISGIKIGQKLDVEIKKPGITVGAVVNEIEPYADPLTRTFLVKATLPDVEGLYPGMYGKLLIPEAYEDAVIIPRAAVKTVGQLKFVVVKEKESFTKRYITTGITVNNMVEVLSGLNQSETIAY